MAEDDEFLNRAIKGDNPHLFFITLVHHVLLCTVENGTASTDPAAEPFHDISTFVDGFLNQEAEITYGEQYQVTMNGFADFCGDQSFVRLALPHNNPLWLLPDVLVHYSKLASIGFFIDFAVSVAGTRLLPLIEHTIFVIKQQVKSPRSLYISSFISCNCSEIRFMFKFANWYRKVWNRHQLLSVRGRGRIFLHD